MQQRNLSLPTLIVLVTLLFCGHKSKAQSDEQINKNSPMFTASMRNMRTMNNYLKKGNEGIITSMMLIGEKKAQYLPLVHTASDIQKLSAEFNTYISSLKDLIGNASNGLHLIDTELWINRISMPKDGNNKAGVEKVLITEEKGAELYKKQNKLGTDCLQLVEKLWSYNELYSTIFCDPSRKDFQIKKVFSDKLLFITSNSTLSQEAWIKENFQDKTIEEVFIILTNLQNQVNLSTNFILNALSEQIGRSNIYYDRFSISAQPETPLVILGDSYEAKIALTTYSTQARITFSVDDQELEKEHGRGLYKVTPTELGEQTYRAKIEVVNLLTGENETFIKTFKYKVVAPK